MRIGMSHIYVIYICYLLFFVIVGMILTTRYISSRSLEGLYEPIYVKIANKLI